ncbi:ATP-dependent DNA helicase Rep [Candidatus Ecksteinia adelgidicola]|nr:ATP-dependent DNA helicase Rep [Candidatus Ecksteinia adelgidicola]
MKLNCNQKQAVEFVTGPCLILAGAGSGKTRVIIEKISYLINQRGYLPQHIAAITFTNKAAREIKERVMQTTQQKKISRLIISTFHALGLEFIKQEYESLKIKPHFSLLNTYDQFFILKKITTKYFKNNNVLVKNLTSMISHWKNNLVNPIQAMQLSQSQRDKLFAHCYDLYNKHTQTFNILDFDDLILLPTLLLDKNKTIQKKWQDYIRYLLVDEYQDTNISQYKLIKLLVGTRAHFTVVGDDDQSIYSWRGAQPQNLVLLKNDFPSLKVIKLEENYRSSKRILKVANILISNNSHMFKKKLFSTLEYGEVLKVITAIDEDQESERVIQELITHRLIKKTSYSDYAILYRGNYQSKAFEKVLVKYKIPYKITNNISFFLRSEIRNLLAYIRILTNPDDDISFLRIINIPKRAIGLTTIKKLDMFSKNINKSLYHTSLDLKLYQHFNSKGMRSLQNFIYWLSNIVKLAKHKPILAIRTLIQEIQYEKWIVKTAINTNIATMQINNINILLNWIIDMLLGNKVDQAITLDQVVERITLHNVVENSKSTEEQDQVQLMTLHASKGLEFPHVFLVGMEEGLLPHQNSINNNNIDEERRLAYVGITRAKKTLIFSLCQQRRQYGQFIESEPSRFLLELPQDDLIWKALIH